MKKLSIIFVLAAFCFSMITPVYAADSTDFSAGGIGIINPKIVFHADTDEGVSKTVTIFNNSSQSINVSAELMDFRLNEYNAYVIEPPNTTEHSATKCLQFEKSDFSLNPGERIDVVIRLLSEVEYYIPELQSTILFKYVPTDSSAQSAGSSVTTYYQIMAFVWVEAGAKYNGNIDATNPPISLIDLDLKNFISSKTPQDISITLKNTGVLTVNPLFTSNIKSNWTNQTTDLPVDMTFLLPNSEKSVALIYSPTQLIDYCTYTLSYHYTYNGKSFEDSISKDFFVVSYPMLGGIGLVLFGLVLQIVLFLKRNKSKNHHQQV